LDAEVFNFYYNLNKKKVDHAIKEYACTAVDVIARRLRLAFLNTYAAHEVLECVVNIMAKRLNWSRKEIEVFLKLILLFLFFS
jgi:glycerol-3-phosphate dehydrogenase